MTAPALSRRALFAGTRTAAPAALPTVNALPESQQPGARQVADISAACLAERGAYCRTCGEACPEDAIRFHLLPQGRARADVAADRCTGCAECLAACPADAIALAAPTLPAGATA